MELLEWAIIAIAVIVALFGGYMFLIWIFKKPKEGEKDAEITKRMELGLSIALIIAGILIFIQRFEIIKWLLDVM